MRVWNAVLSFLKKRWLDFDVVFGCSIQVILSQCFISIRMETIRKPSGFLIFSGCIEQQDIGYCRASIWKIRNLEKKQNSVKYVMPSFQGIRHYTEIFLTGNNFTGCKED